MTGAPIITIDTRQIEGLAAVMRAMPKEFPGIAKRTINWVGNKARTQVFRALAQQTGLTYGDVSDQIRTYPASEFTLAYRLHASGAHTTLRHFAPRQTRAGVSARPWGKRRVFRGSFIVRSLNAQVFKRTGSARLPIEVLYGPAVPKEMLKGAVPPAATFTVQAEFLPRLSHEFRRALLSQLKGKIKSTGAR